MISTTPKKPMKNNSITINVDVHRQDEHRTHDNDIIDHKTKVQTPRKRAYFELRNEGVSPSKLPRIVKSKLVLAIVLTGEIETLISNIVKATLLI
jgi:hypothetical protein